MLKLSLMSFYEFRGISNSIRISYISYQVEDCHYLLLPLSDTMSPLSNESIIAIVTLVATCPPSILLIGHVLRRKYLEVQPEVQGTSEQIRQRSRPHSDLILDVERTSRSRINLEVIKHVKDTILQPVTAYLTTR